MNKRLLLTVSLDFALSATLHADIITHFIESLFTSSDTKDSEYPLSDAPAKVIAEKDSSKKYSETFIYDTYHHVQATYPFKKGGRIELSNVNGSVIIETAETNDVIAIDLLLDPQVLKAPIKTTLNVNPASAVAQIKTEVLKSNARIACRMKITVPRKTDVHVKSVNGKIVLESATGSADLQATNGAIVLRNHTGTATLRTTNGIIEASNITGAIDFRTTNGNIEAKDVRAENALHVESTNGAIELDLLSVKNIKHATIESMNGAIEVTLAKSVQGTVLAETMNGKVKGDIWKTATFGKQTKKEVTLGKGQLHMKLRTMNASIEADFGEKD